MERTITNEFIDVMWDFSHKEIPPEIIDECKVSLLDYIACANLGAKLLYKENREWLNAFGRNSGLSSVIGMKEKVNAGCAAMLNGVNAHYIELDDGHRYAMLHPGVPVISALLAAAQDKGLDGRSLVRGIAAGYEVTIRLAKAVQPEHKLRGYHATGTCGTIGAAIGVISALGFPKELWNTVIGAAATSAAGLLQVIDDGSELKPFNAGRAAASAVEAAYFGMSGLKGPTDVLGGKRGFFTVAGGKLDRDVLLERNDAYAIKGIYRKPYAACRHSHAAIEAMLNICGVNDVKFGDIQRIEVLTYGLAVKGHEHTEIIGAGSAKMSIPYAVCAAAKYGKVNFQEYESGCLNDRDILNLMKCVSVREDEELSGLVPKKRAAIVKVITAGGEYKSRVDYPLGEPENPMSKPMMEEKYRSMMDAADKTKAETEDILDDVYHLESRLPNLLESI